MITDLTPIPNPASLGFSSARLSRIRPTMQGYVDAGKLAGIQTLILRRGEVVHHECVGMRNIAAGQPLTPDTIYRIYSMTKPITTVAALMLYEEGRFHLFDEVADYLPMFKDLRVCGRPGVLGPEMLKPSTPLTIHHLMTHTGGLSYGWFEDTPVDAMYRKAGIMEPNRNSKAWVEKVASLPLVTHPGTRWRYSVSTDILGYLVEVLSGMRLGDFFQERIFGPLGMIDTAFHVPETKLDRFAATYGPKLEVVDAPETSMFADATRSHSGGGGLVGTTGDYLRFAKMLLNRGELDGARLLGRKTVELMTANHLPSSMLPFFLGENEARGCGFGLGVRMVQDVPATEMMGSVGEYGWGGAANTDFFVDPAEEMVGLFMTQFMPSDTFMARRDFRNMAYQALVD